MRAQHFGLALRSPLVRRHPDVAAPKLAALMFDLWGALSDAGAPCGCFPFDPLMCTL